MLHSGYFSTFLAVCSMQVLTLEADVTIPGQDTAEGCTGRLVEHCNAAHTYGLVPIIIRLQFKSLNTWCSEFLYMGVTIN